MASPDREEAAPRREGGADAPGEPTWRVRSARSEGLAAGLREAWDRREVLLLLAWRDVVVRYRQALFGIAWALVRPLLASGVLTVFLGAFARVPHDGDSYFLATLVGMVPWTFFQGAVAAGSQSLVGNADLVTKVYFPRVHLPLATMGAPLVDLVVTGIFLAVVLLARGVVPTPAGLGRTLLATLVLVVLASGLAAGTAAVNVRFRDVRFTVPFLLQAMFFATPVVFPVSAIPAEYRLLAGLNPMVGVVDSFRAGLLGTAAAPGLLPLAAAISLGIAGVAWWVFRSLERGFADTI